MRKIKMYGTAVPTTVTATATGKMDAERGQIEVANDGLFNLQAV